MLNNTFKGKFSFRTQLVPLLAVLSVLLVLTAACGGPAAQPEAAVEPTPAPAETEAPAEAITEPAEAAASERGTGGTVRLLFWQAPTTANPHLSPGTKDLNASRVAYEPLASFDKDGNMVTFLAAEIPSLENGGVAADGKSVTWKLKEGVQWADGEPFTADDVLFTYEYLTNPDVPATTIGTYSGIESVEVIDDFTVRINFEDVNPAWTLPFVGNQGMIMPRHIFEEYNGSNFNDAPANLLAVGTGPYRVAEFRAEDILLIGEDAVNTIKIIYEPNPYFREPNKPFFSRVELDGGGDAVIAAQAVRNGITDFAWNIIGGGALAQLEGSDQVSVVAFFDAFVERIMINFTDPNRETADGERSSLQFPHPFFSDKKVRQALALAIDRETIAELYGATGRPTTNLLVAPPNYSSPNTSFEFNPDKAAALLDEAGWVDTNDDGVRDKEDVKLSVVFQTSINPVRQQTQEIVKRNLEAVGFEVETKQIDSSIFFGPVEENTNTRRHFYADLEEFAFSNKSPDPGAYMKGWTCDEVAQKANNWALSNWGRYCNPAYDALFQQSATEMDPEKRQQLFIQMNDILIEDVALIPLVDTAQPAAISSALEGYETTPWDVDVWLIKDWRRKE